VNPEARLAEVAAALESVGLSYLVMGGHAVRFYGISRNTIDCDLHLSPQDWDALPERLAQSPLFAGRRSQPAFWSLESKTLGSAIPKRSTVVRAPTR
jgi:hypothetical protein